MLPDANMSRVAVFFIETGIATALFATGFLLAAYYSKTYRGR
jgi:hypothetical protein